MITKLISAPCNLFGCLLLTRISMLDNMVPENRAQSTLRVNNTVIGNATVCTEL